jgi:hypothetical protein
MKPTFIHASCVEGRRLDLRQAGFVARRRPDMIFFELPASGGKPSLIFNRYAPGKKPIARVQKIKDKLRETARTYPYALSDVKVWENIEKLWREGHNVLLFNIDAPQELRFHHHERYGHIPYSRAKNHWWFWAYLLIRERRMADYIQGILKKHQGKKKLVIAVFLQSIHWRHVRFLLGNPSQKAVWKYYFGKFPEVTPSNIGQLIKKEDRILCKYWKKGI